MEKKSSKHAAGCQYREFSKSVNKVFVSSDDKQLIVSTNTIHLFDHPAGESYRIDVEYCPCCGINLI